jgi:hypothetical protein
MGKIDDARYIIMPESNILWGMIFVSDLSISGSEGVQN